MNRVAHAGVVVLLALNIAASQTQPTAEWTGTFKASSGSPLTNFQVDLQTFDKKTVATSTTDKNGSVQIRELSPGWYLMRAEEQPMWKVSEAMWKASERWILVLPGQNTSTVVIEERWVGDFRTGCFFNPPKQSR
jgi:hypothetical protein